MLLEYCMHMFLGYCMHASTRKDGRGKQGGGLAVLYNTRLEVFKLVVASDPVSFELLPLLLTCQDCVLTLLLIYRAPSSSVTNFLQELLDLLDEFTTARLLVCGDFNLPRDG